MKEEEQSPFDKMSNKTLMLFGLVAIVIVIVINLFSRF